MTLWEGEVPFMVTKRLAGIYRTICDTTEKKHPANMAFGFSSSWSSHPWIPSTKPVLWVPMHSQFTPISNLPRELGDRNLPFRKHWCFPTSLPPHSSPHLSLHLLYHFSLLSATLLSLNTYFGNCELYMSPNFTKNNLQGFTSLTLLLSYWLFPEWYE